MITARIHRVTHLLIATGLVISLFAIAGTQAAEEVAVSPPTETSPQPETGKVQERGFAPRVAPGGLRGIAAPHQLQMVGPTPNLTAVANGFELRHKSLTTLILVAPNLPVTQPVEISIGYYSPAGTQRITQSYVRGTGNRFLYNDPAGDGKPRQMRVDISLMERNPAGQPYTFAFSKQVNLDPLYDVAIGPLHFSLISNCDAVGNNEILFAWTSPDDKNHKFEFICGRAGSKCFVPIAPFAWASAEVSWSHKLIRPSFRFWDKDHPVVETLWECHRPGCGFEAPITPPINLLPGKTQTVKGNLKARNDSCEAYYEYQITYTLRWYPYL
jgi:hypothetical protein